MGGHAKAYLLLALHFVTFGAEILVVIVFWQTENWHSFWTCLAMLLFSGFFFVDAVWRGVLWRPFGVEVLPVRRLLCCRKTCCCLPLLLLCGCLQGVMVPLTLEHAQMGNGRRSMNDHETSDSKVAVFHSKAVTGLFEGIVCSAMVLYAYLGSDFPKGSSHPITKDPADWPLKCLGLRHILRTIVLISFGSGCLGILHLDHCICLKLGAYIRSGPCPCWRLFQHWLFRTCELVSRVSLHVLFLLLLDESILCWRWVPLVLSMVSSVVMVYIHGGNEASYSVRLLCGFLCTFVDVFRFIDSPYKRQAARSLSRVLEWRHAIELTYMPCAAVLLMGEYAPGAQPGIGIRVGAARVARSLTYLVHEHPLALFIMAVAIPLYFSLLCSMSVQRFLESERNIFAACGQLDVDEVRRLALGGMRVDVNRVNAEGRTPLARTILYGIESDERCAEICGILLESGARVDVKAPCEHSWIRRLSMREARLRWTPLHLAARRGSVPVLRQLMASVPPGAGAEDYRDLVGETPLHVAMSFRRTEAVRCLVGMFPEWAAVANHAGRTPQDLARTNDLREALRSPALVAHYLPHRDQSSSSTLLSWAVQDLAVQRVSNSRGLSSAPGLCSYVVGAAGGPIVGTVLKLRPQEEEPSPEPQSSGPRIPAAVPSAHLCQVPEIRAEELEPVSKDSRAVCPEWRTHAVRADFLGNNLSIIRAKGFCREAVLGSGTFGVVWLGRRKGGGPDDVYAVKNVSYGGSMSRVVQRECELSDWIRIIPHPCIVTLFGVQEFVDAQLCVTVMEFIPGVHLLEAIRAARKASWAGGLYESPPETMPWLGQIFLALEHLHLRMRVLLRDLKPSNIVLDSHRRAKLIDLGLGRLGTQSDGAFTLTPQAPGTPGYCAPEVLRQLPYDEKADLYSFGVTAWVLLTGGQVHRNPPGPPTGYNGLGMQSCFNDCHLLHRCINAPRSNKAVKLATADAYAFVMSLTAVKRNLRPDHKAIRKHKFFTEHLPRPLPEFDTGREGVEWWLVETGF